MQPIESIKVDLPPHISTSVTEAVESGQYYAPGELVLALLEQWQLRQKILREELGKLWDKGIASGRTEPFTVEDIMTEVHKRRAAKK